MDWISCARGRVVGRKKPATPCSCLSAVGLAEGSGRCRPGTREVLGPPPGSSSRALQEEQGAGSWRLCAVLQQLSSPIFIQLSFPAWKMRIKSAHTFKVYFQAPTPGASLGNFRDLIKMLKLSHITCDIVVNFPISPTRHGETSQKHADFEGVFHWLQKNIFRYCC